MKEYLEGMKKWMMIFFIIYLGAAMGCGTIFFIYLITEGKFGYVLIFIVYPFLIPLFKIAWQAVYKQDDKSKRSIWVNLPPPPHGARCVATSTKPVHPPVEK